MSTDLGECSEWLAKSRDRIEASVAAWNASAATENAMQIRWDAEERDRQTGSIVAAEQTFLLLLAAHSGIETCQISCLLRQDQEIPASPVRVFRLLSQLAPGVSLSMFQDGDSVFVNGVKTILFLAEFSEESFVRAIQMSIWSRDALNNFFAGELG